MKEGLHSLLHFKIPSRNLLFSSGNSKEEMAAKEHALIQCRPPLLSFCSVLWRWRPHYLIMGFFGGYHTESEEDERGGSAAVDTG